MPDRIIQHGSGWFIFERNGDAWLKFNHKPDGETLTKLRAFARYETSDKAWRAPYNWLDALKRVADKAQTWESIGETPDSWGEDFGPGPNGDS